MDAISFGSGSSLRWGAGAFFMSAAALRTGADKPPAAIRGDLIDSLQFWMFDFGSADLAHFSLEEAAMDHADAACPVTGDTVHPLLQIPTGRCGTKPPIIICPSCGRKHQWRPASHKLVDLGPDEDASA